MHDPPQGLLPVLLVLTSAKQVLEQHSLTFTHCCCPHPSPGAAAGAAGAEFREASLGATLLHFCSLLLSAPPPLELLPVLLQLCHHLLLLLRLLLVLLLCNCSG